MGVRTKVEAVFAVGEGTQLDDTIFEVDEFAQVLDTLDRATVTVITLAGAEALFAVPMGDVASGRMLYLEADREVDVRLSGVGNTPINVKRPGDPAASGTVGMKALLMGHFQFTSIHLTNPDATNSVRVKICIVGDLVT